MIKSFNLYSRSYRFPWYFSKAFKTEHIIQFFNVEHGKACSDSVFYILFNIARFVHFVKLKKPWSVKNE